MKNSFVPIIAGALVSVVLPAYCSQVAYWNFDEGSGTVLHDRSGNGNDGTIHGAVWDAGILGKSLYFNGTDNYVELSNPTPFKLQQFTLSCWIKPVLPYSSQDRVFFSNIEASSGISYGFVVRFRYAGSNPCNLCLARADGVDHWINLDRVVSFDTAQYHFVAASYDGSVMRLYFDSTLVGENTYSGGIEYSSVKPNIGGSIYNNTDNGFFKGNIDEMQIFNTALSAAEIKKLFQQKRFATADFLIPLPSPTRNRKPLLTWHAISGATYNVEADTITSFAKPIFSVPTADTFYQVAVDLPIDTIYWKVTAGINDTLQYLSNIGSFIIQDPKIPIIIPYEPKVTTERRLLFTWYSVSGASSYVIQVANNGAFASALYNIPVSDTFYSFTTDLPIGPVYWRVKSDLIDAWSTMDKVTIQPDSIPVLIPFKGASVSTQRPTFQWHAVAKAVSYKIEIADNTLFTGAYSVPVTDTLYAPTVDLNSGLWYWHVSCSRNIAGFSAIDSLRIPTVGSTAHTPNTASPRQPYAIRTEGRNIVVVSSSEAGEPREIRVYTMLGRQILFRQTREKAVAMEVSRGGSGLYFVDIIHPRGVYRGKIFLY